MRNQRAHNRKRYDNIVFLYSEGYDSTWIMNELQITEPSYWRILADGGGMPMWAKLDNIRNKAKRKGVQPKI